MVEKRDRNKHPERQYDEPWIEWTRIRFPSETTSELELKAEFETDADLLKPIPQLVCEFHVKAKEAKWHGSSDAPILLEAQSRMVAMMAQVAMKNDKVSDRMVELTDRIADSERWLVRVTVIIGILTLATIVIAFLK